MRRENEHLYFGGTTRLYGARETKQSKASCIRKRKQCVGQVLNSRPPDQELVWSKTILDACSNCHISNPTKADPNRPSAGRSNISLWLMEWFIGSGMPHTPDYFISVKVGNSTNKKNRLLEGVMLHKGKDKPQAFIDKSCWKGSTNHY